MFPSLCCFSSLITELFANCLCEIDIHSDKNQQFFVLNFVLNTENTLLFALPIYLTFKTYAIQLRIAIIFY